MSKKILITGGSGFIAHHIVEHILRNTDWEIVSIDRLNTSGNLNRFTDLECWEKEGHRVKNVFHDLRSEVNQFVAKEIGPVDYILHMAASTHVDRSIEDPMAFVLDNVVATTNILNFARRFTKIPTFLYFSTDEVFGPAPYGTNYKEWDRYNSGNPYAAAKAGGEEMALAFANTYRIPTIITHTMNVYGERQHPEKFIPMCIKKILAGETVTIHSNKDKTRPGSRYWIHARNVASAIIFLLERAHWVDKKPEKFNIVGEMEVNNLEMASFIASVLGKELKYEMTDFHSSRPGHDLRYALDGAKMKSLGWELPKNFHDSLKKTIEWSVDPKNIKWLS